MAERKSKKLKQHSRASSIENSLLTRHNELKTKLDAIKLRTINKELRNNQPAPQICFKSKRLASKSQKQILFNPDRIHRTYDILKNSRFLPKKLKLSLNTLQSLSSTCKNSPCKHLRYDTALTTPRTESPITFPSLQKILRSGSSYAITPLPADISQRNELLFSLKPPYTDSKDASTPKPKLLIQERSQIWLQKKQEKMSELRKQKERCSVKSLGKPESSLQRVSTKSTQRTLSARSCYSVGVKGHLRTGSMHSVARSEIDIVMQGKQSSKSSNYLGISPICIPVSYSTGYSQKLFQRSKPLINYKTLSALSS